MRFIAAAIPLITLLAASASAMGVAITDINWQLSRLNGKKRAPYAAVTSLRAAPGVKFTDRLRALVTLKNTSQDAADGLVLRYSLRLQLLRDGAPAENAFWCVPFFVEEMRVNMVKPMSERQAKIIRFELQNQLARLRGTGFSPKALKMEVMLGPRQGDDPAEVMREAVIPILKP